MAKKKTKEQIDHATTQEHIPLATVRDGIAIMKDGGMRVILMVGAINFSLKSEEEQNAIVYQYQSFLNSINFPIQILVQSRIMDLTQYLKGLEDRHKNQSNELLSDITESYIDFVEGLIENASIMNKRFYAIIPLQPITALPKNKGFGIFKKKEASQVRYSDKDFTHYRQELLEKAQVVASGLSSLGLQVVALNTQQIIELLYSSYNPEEGITEKLTNVDDLESTVVTEDPSALEEQILNKNINQELAKTEPIKSSEISLPTDKQLNIPSAVDETKPAPEDSKPVVESKPASPVVTTPETPVEAQASVADTKPDIQETSEPTISTQPESKPEPAPSESTQPAITVTATSTEAEQTPATKDSNVKN